MMEDLDTLNGSISWELTDLPILSTTQTPLKTPKTKLMCEAYAGNSKIPSIITNNLRQSSSEIQEETGLALQEQVQGQVVSPSRLREKYKELKGKYMSSENKRRYLQNILTEHKTQPCKNCEILRRTNEGTKKALEEAIQVTNILLREIKTSEAKSK